MSAKDCPKCGTLSDWEFGELRQKTLYKGTPFETEITFRDAKGLKCPNCGNLFQHPAEGKALNALGRLARK